MTLVVKRDNKKERFDDKKIRRSIEAAAREAGLSEDNVKHLVDEVSKSVIDCARCEKVIRSAAIRDDVPRKLDATEPAVSRTWRDFDSRTKGVTC